jgi:DNA modification methylase
MWYEELGITSPFYGDDSVCVVCGDCREILSKLPDCSVDLVLTSPSYNVGMDYDDYNDNISWDEYNRLAQETNQLAFKISKGRDVIMGRLLNR